MTEDLLFTLSCINRNNETVDRDPIKKVLVYYGEDVLYMGDCCISFGQLRHFKRRLNDASLHLNFQPGKNQRFYDAILQNNPHVDELSRLDWADIDPSQYDVLFCISYKETEILQSLHDNYGDKIRSGECKLAVFSISKQLLYPEPNHDIVFSENKKLVEEMRVQNRAELYISDEERDWADGWLASKGVEKDDQLFICCDAASVGYKLLNTVEYFDFLEFLCKKKRSKILIFDERGIGKADFYKDWMGDRAKDQLIVSEKLSLRENLRLIGSRSTRLVFGPCTGLLHCASSIFNHYVDKGMPLSDVPVLITYTGTYSRGKNARVWWDYSPLVQCLLLKNVGGAKQIRLLSEMSPEEKELNDSLPCIEYTADMLIDFINSRSYFN